MSKNENNGYALEINNLNKQYKTSEFELKNVAFRVPAGTVVGLIGENGSGKTTTLSSILGLTNYESGTIKYMGAKVSSDDVKIKETIGVVMGDDCFPGALTPKDLDIVMKRVYSKWDSKKFADCLHAFNIQHKKRIKDFSSGMKRKVALAVAVSHNPNLLICDEVTSGLDPVSRETVLDLLMGFMQDQDIDKLRKDMLDNCYALFFASDIVAALAETPDIEQATDEELIEMAQRQGIDLRKYEI